jgi:hypothetical protein
VPSESQKSNAKIGAVTHAVVDRDVGNGDVFRKPME